MALYILDWFAFRELDLSLVQSRRRLSSTRSIGLELLTFWFWRAHQVANCVQPIPEWWWRWRLLLLADEGQGTNCKNGSATGWHSSTGNLILKKSCTWLVTCPAEQAVRATPIPVTWMTREEDSLLTGQVSFRISMQMGSLRQHIRRTGDNIGLWAR